MFNSEYQDTLAILEQLIAKYANRARMNYCEVIEGPFVYDEVLYVILTCAGINQDDRQAPWPMHERIKILSLVIELSKANMQGIQMNGFQTTIIKVINDLQHKYNVDFEYMYDDLCGNH